MRFISIKTRKFLPPRDDIYDLIDRSIKNLRDGDILIVASKILGIHQGRCVPIKQGSNAERDLLARAEADYYIPRGRVPNQMILPTIKYHTLIASAGIDKSNGAGYYVFWPKRPNRLLRDIWRHLTKKHKLKRLGLIAADSHFLPLRVGSVGVAMAFYGFEPVIDYRGQPDIFGRKLELTRVNIPDALAAPATLLMGEGSEQTPLMIARGFKGITFSSKDHYQNFLIKREEDIYYPLLKPFRKTRKQ